MKLSKITTDRAMDVLCEITPNVANIVTDEELMAELKKAVDPNDVETKAGLLAKGVERVAKIVPIILKKRKFDMFGILAALNEKTIEEIGKQNILVTMSQVRDIVKDKDLMDFFKSCVGSEGSE
jgi:hypothetical protein